MHTTADYIAAPFLGLVAILILGCHDASGPAALTTGAIEITVSTSSSTADLDPDGYTVTIDGGPSQSVGINTTLTISALPAGNHFVLLAGLAPNCSVTNSNPRSVDVTSDEAALTVFFSVSCTAKPGPWDY